MPGVGLRSRRFTDPHPLRGFGGRQNPRSCVFLASAVSAGGVNEKQTVTITGTPAGGTFTLTYAGATTAAIAYNATAAVVEAALELLSTIGVGQVNVAGGALPGTAVVVEFTGDLQRTDVGLMTASGASLTGGTTPAVGVAQTIQGNNADAGHFIVKRGLIIKAAPTDATRVVAYDGTGTILGVLTQTYEFMSREDISDTDLAYYPGPGCDFLSKNVRGADGTFATYESAFDTWAASKGCIVTKGAV